METIKIKTLHSGVLHTYFKIEDKTIRCGNIVLSKEEPVELQIEGRINSSDIIFLRGLCGGEIGFSRRKSGYVKVLNLENIVFDFDNTPYFKTRSDYRTGAAYGTKSETITSYK